MPARPLKEGSTILRKVEHVGIQVRDLDRSIKHYTEVLGLVLRKRVPTNETRELALIRNSFHHQVTKTPRGIG